MKDHDSMLVFVSTAEANRQLEAVRRGAVYAREHGDAESEKVLSEAADAAEHRFKEAGVIE